MDDTRESLQSMVSVRSSGGEHTNMMIIGMVALCAVLSCGHWLIRMRVAGGLTVQLERIMPTSWAILLHASM